MVFSRQRGGQLATESIDINLHATSRVEQRTQKECSLGTHLQLLKLILGEHTASVELHQSLDHGLTHTHNTHTHTI